MRIGADIAERLLDVGVQAVRIAGALPKDAAARHVALQLVRSVTSAGANYEEARAAESRADFVHKVSLAAKEMREGSYWIQLVSRSGWTGRDLEETASEARALAAILAASARTARSHQENT